MASDELELDDGIKDVVELLRDNGIDTFSSCEGGDGHAFDMPTVRINFDRINFDADVDEIAKILITNGYFGFYVSKHWAYGADEALQMFGNYMALEVSDSQYITTNSGR